MCRRFAKCIETLTNIILGQMDYNGCFTTSIPQNSAFWFKWSRVVASQLRYPKIVHSGLKHKFFIFLQAEVSEMLRNTPKHHFGSNGVEWMLRKFDTRNSAYWFKWSRVVASLLRCTKIVHFVPKHKFRIFLCGIG
jgi:hypothetical protein